VAEARPPEPLRTGRWDSPQLWTDDGFLVEAFGDGWALLSHPLTGEAWTLHGVVHLDEDGDELERRDWRGLGFTWGAERGH